jgi:hypothetical protein
MQTLLVETFGPLVGACLLLVVVLGLRRLKRGRMTPEQRQAERDAFRNRLVHPKPSEVEQSVGGLLPQRLLALYDDHRTILTEEIEIAHPSLDEEPACEWIEAFLPLDSESQKFTVDLPEQGWGKGFCFATDGAGNFYWVPVNETRQPDAPVFFACHDPHGNEKVADSLDQFLSWPRKLHGAEDQSP